MRINHLQLVDIKLEEIDFFDPELEIKDDSTIISEKLWI